jgi:superfamily II DNA/RNA helicase
VSSQVLLVSATVTKEALFLLKRFAPRAASVDLNPTHQVAANVKHVAYVVTSRRKAALLEYLLKRKGSFRVSRSL